MSDQPRGFVRFTSSAAYYDADGNLVHECDETCGHLEEDDDDDDAEN